MSRAQPGACRRRRGSKTGLTCTPSCHAHPTTSPGGGRTICMAARMPCGWRRCPLPPTPARLQDVDELLMREVDPPGERYALSKVLHTCQARYGTSLKWQGGWSTCLPHHIPPTWGCVQTPCPARHIPPLTRALGPPAACLSCQSLTHASPSHSCFDPALCPAPLGRRQPEGRPRPSTPFGFLNPHQKAFSSFLVLPPGRPARHLSALHHAGCRVCAALAAAADDAGLAGVYEGERGGVERERGQRCCDWGGLPAGVWRLG